MEMVMVMVMEMVMETDGDGDGTGDRNGDGDGDGDGDDYSQCIARRLKYINMLCGDTDSFQLQHFEILRLFQESVELSWTY